MTVKKKKAVKKKVAEKQVANAGPETSDDNAADPVA